MGLVLGDEIADAPRRLEFALVDDGHAVANGFHFAQLVFMWWIVAGIQ